MRHAIRGSEVYVSADTERILNALAGAARRYSGDYGAGYADALRDVATSIGATVDAPMMERITETVEYRAERTVERYQAPAPERYQAPAVARHAPVDMTGDDVSLTLFNPQRGELRTRAGGYVWAGHDGYTAFWDAADWQRVTVEEARAWGDLIPDDYAVLVRHSYADGKRRQLEQSVRVLPTERRQLR